MENPASPAPYRVELAPGAERGLRQLPEEVQSRLGPPILALAHEPRPPGVRKLRGEEHTWRIRVGAYRVVYDVDDHQRLVVVLKVDRRRESTYRR